jgi:hypothetical protein
MRGVKDNGTNKDVLRRLIIERTINVRQSSLQLVISILNKKNIHLERVLKLGLVNEKY